MDPRLSLSLPDNSCCDKQVPVTDATVQPGLETDFHFGQLNSLFITGKAPVVSSSPFSCVNTTWCWSAPDKPAIGSVYGRYNQPLAVRHGFAIKSPRSTWDWRSPLKMFKWYWKAVLVQLGPPEPVIFLTPSPRVHTAAFKQTGRRNPNRANLEDLKSQQKVRLLPSERVSNGGEHALLQL